MRRYRRPPRREIFCTSFMPSLPPHTTFCSSVHPFFFSLNVRPAFLVELPVKTSLFPASGLEEFSLPLMFGPVVAFQVVIRLACEMAPLLVSQIPSFYVSSVVFLRLRAADSSLMLPFDGIRPRGDSSILPIFSHRRCSSTFGGERSCVAIFLVSSFFLYFY